MENSLSTSEQYSSASAQPNVDVETEVYPIEWMADEQWHTWKPEGDSKPPRAPWNNPLRPNQKSDAQDEGTWTNFETAHAATREYDGHKLAHNIRDREQYPDESSVLIDGDGVRNPETGEYHPDWLMCLQHAESYADVSVSMGGSHILGTGQLPDSMDGFKSALPEHPDFPGAQIEVYDSKRFVAMSGQHIRWTPRSINDVQPVIDEVLDKIPEAVETDSADDSTYSSPAGSCSLDRGVGDFLKSAREYDEYLNQLIDCLGAHSFEPGQYSLVRYSDRSRNEVALACKLMRRFGGFEEYESIVRQVMNQLNPPKWTERDDEYRNNVIRKAKRYSVDIGEFYQPTSSSDRAGGVLQKHADRITLIVKYNMGETFTTGEVAELIGEIGERQTRKVLNDLKAAGYLSKRQIGLAEHFEKVREIDTTTTIYDLFLERYNTADEVREIRREYLSENDDGEGTKDYDDDGLTESFMD